MHSFLCNRWDLIENFLEEEICDSCAEIDDSELKKWLEYVGLVVEAQRWELANSLFRKISDIASRSCSAVEQSSWEDAQFTWAFTAAQRMKDYNLASSIVDDVIMAHQNSRLKNPKRVGYHELVLVVTMLHNSNDRHELCNLFPYCNKMHLLTSLCADV